MCEIEHFVDPTNKNHPKFNQVSHLELTLYSACDQNAGKEPSKMRIGDAVLNKIVNNETLGYYMARTHLYLVSVGIDSAKLRFRQHLNTEMAHYAEVNQNSNLYKQKNILTNTKTNFFVRRRHRHFLLMKNGLTKNAKYYWIAVLFTLV